MSFNDSTGVKGTVEITIKKKDGTSELRRVTNRLVNDGKDLLLKALSGKWDGGALSINAIGLSQSGATVTDGDTYVEEDWFFETALNPVSDMEIDSDNYNLKIEKTFDPDEIGEGMVLRSAGLFYGEGEQKKLYSKVTVPAVEISGDNNGIVLRWVITFSSVSA